MWKPFTIKQPRKSISKKPRSYQPDIEALETRFLLAAALEDGLALLVGSSQGPALFDDLTRNSLDNFAVIGPSRPKTGGAADSSAEQVGRGSGEGNGFVPPHASENNAPPQGEMGMIHDVTPPSYNAPLQNLSAGYSGRLLGLSRPTPIPGVTALVPGPAGPTGPSSTSTNYYVSTTGSDANPGTITQPFLTINHGVSVLTAGDRLLIRGGTYNEALLDDIPSGTSGSAPVTVSAYASESVVLHPTSGSYVIALRGTFNYIVLKGLTIDASSVTDSAVYLAYDDETFTAPSHIRIENSEVKNAPHQGIIVEAGTTAGSTPDHNEFVNLKVHDNGTTSTGHGFYIQSSHNLIQGCDIYHNAGEGIQIFKSGGVNGINCSYNVIDDNKVHDNGQAGGTEVGIGLYVGDGNLAYNNLIWQDFIGIAVEYGASNTLLYNNDIYNNTGDAGILVGYDLGATNTIIRNDILWQNTRPIRDFGTGTVQDHNLTTDPLFVNAPADFHLQAGSPAINAGTTLFQVRYDFDGLGRPQGTAYCIGAYEYHA